MDAEIHVLDHDARQPKPAHHYRMSLTPGPHSARHLRRIIRAYLTEWGLPSLAEEAELGATELLANVVRHVPGTVCTVLLRRCPGGVRVEVHDSDPRLPVVRDAADLDEGGRGLRLLSALTDAWDAERTGPSSKVVWFELLEPGLPERVPSTIPTATGSP